MNILIIKYYMPDDEDFKGDYTKIEIWRDGEILQRYGDYYHEKGLSKVEGFLDCLEALNINYNVNYQDKHDPDFI